MNTFEKIAHLAQVEALEKYAGQTAATIGGSFPVLGLAAAPLLADENKKASTFGGALTGSLLGAGLLGVIGSVAAKKMFKNNKNLITDTLKHVTKERDEAQKAFNIAKAQKAKIRNASTIRNFQDTQHELGKAQQRVDNTQETFNQAVKASGIIGAGIGGGLGMAGGGGLGAYLGHGPDKK